MGLISRVSSRTYRRLLTKKCLIRLFARTPVALATPRRSSTSESDGPLRLRRRQLRRPDRSDEPSDSTQPTPSDDASKPPAPVNLTEPPRSSRKALSQALSLSWSPADTAASESCS